MRTLFLILGVVFGLTNFAVAADGIVVHAVFFGTGKFHRINNKKHTYPKTHSFIPAIMPDTIKNPRDLEDLRARSSVVPSIDRLKSGEYRFFYFNTDQLVRGLVQAYNQTKKPISRIHYSGHGMPGGNIVPANYEQMIKPECDWIRGGVMKDDIEVYNSYYGIDDSVSFDEIFKSILSYTQDTKVYAQTGAPAHIADCSTRLDYWQNLARRFDFSKLMAQDAKISFYTCHQALGKKGEEFMRGFAELFFPTGRGKRGEVRATDTYGANDWSIKSGMVGADPVDTPASFQKYKKWYENRADVYSASPFTLVTAQQRGQGVKLIKQKTLLMPME